MVKKVEKKIGKHNLIIETGKLAKQADGAVTVQYGGTVVLVTAVMSKEEREGINFLPLTVEYMEKTYAAGRIPGGFFKREGRPTQKEILTARLIDRPVRPLFPEGLTRDIQIVAIVLCSDGENDPDILAVVGASAALTISNIPFLGPIGAIKIGMISNEFIINPTYAELAKSDMELALVGGEDGVIMLEFGGREVPEDVIIKAAQHGKEFFATLMEMQKELAAKCGTIKIKPEYKLVSDELYKKVKDLTRSRLNAIDKMATKDEREETMDIIARDLVTELVTENSGYSEADVKAALEKVEKEHVREMVLVRHERPDGRAFDQVRQITCETSILPRTHGSGLFTRGQTQSLAITTLGTSSDEQMIEALEGKSYKSFMLHYSFPPFSVGEVRPMRGPGRREIGHGALAERALLAVMPSKEEFPYTVRVVSEILESNGSSSMASVCAGTLSLMDAGVPIKSPVSGIAMGLVKQGKDVAVLTDIAGLEDHYGDMDFKVTGTRKGVTALQLDVKTKDGIDEQIMVKAFAQARAARLMIMDKIEAIIAHPRQSISEYAPRITTIHINPEKIKDVIGPGGKIIKKIIEQTGVTIDIEDDGSVNVASTDSAAVTKALDIINKIVEEVEVGKMYMGKVKRIMNFGAFCEILPNKEGLVHVSELDDKYVAKVEDIVKIGDEFMVKVIEIDNMGRINLSRKQAMKSQDKGEKGRAKD